MVLNTIESINASANSSNAAPSLGELAGEDFLKLMIAQLTNQDPLEPMGNQELLEQISSIRDIELSMTLTKSLQALAGQEHYSAASSLIGRYVTGSPEGASESVSGIVVGVRFEADNKPVLQLASGVELAADQVVSIKDPQRVGESMVGQTVVGIDRRGAAGGNLVEGIVTGLRTDAEGNVVLELDGGDDLRLRDVTSSAPNE